MKGKHVKSENIIKKIICMVIVFMMMTSNLMTPVTILASDLNCAPKSGVYKLLTNN